MFHQRRRLRGLEDERRECQRQVSELMDAAPEWKGWLAGQLELLDLEYDPHHWLTFEEIR
jgi:hypothetical protein